MENKKIAVYYIATGSYKSLFHEFLETLPYLFPNCNKTVKLISDGLEEYKDYERGNIKVELCPRINHYPWPVIALYKMWHILVNYQDDFDYACYFNANSLINPHDESIFDLSKLTVSYHSFNSTFQPYNPWPYININPSSVAYLENGSYEYIQSGFFFGPNWLFKKMCKEIVELVREDSHRLLFAQWHDESYLNKWCVDNKELVDKRYIMTIYPTDVDKERFILLRNKKDYSIDKSKMINSDLEIENL